MVGSRASASKTLLGVEFLNPKAALIALNCILSSFAVNFFSFGFTMNPAYSMLDLIANNWLFLFRFGRPVQLYLHEPPSLSYPEWSLQGILFFLKF